MGLLKRLRVLLRNKKKYPRIKAYRFYRKDFWGTLRLKRLYRYRKAIYDLLKRKRKFYKVLLYQIYKGVKFFHRKITFQGNLFLIKKILKFFYYKITDKQIGKLGKLFMGSAGNLVNRFFLLLESRLDVLLVRSLYFFLVKESNNFIIMNNVFVNNLKINKPNYLVKVTDIISVFVYPKVSPFFFFNNKYMTMDKSLYLLNEYDNIFRKKILIFKVILYYFFFSYIKILKKKKVIVGYSFFNIFRLMKKLIVKKSLLIVLLKKINFFLFYFNFSLNTLFLFFLKVYVYMFKLKKKLLRFLNYNSNYFILKKKFLNLIIKIKSYILKFKSLQLLNYVSFLEKKLNVINNKIKNFKFGISIEKKKNYIFFNKKVYKIKKGFSYIFKKKYFLKKIFFFKKYIFKFLNSFRFFSDPEKFLYKILNYKSYKLYSLNINESYIYFRRGFFTKEIYYYYILDSYLKKKKIEKINKNQEIILKKKIIKNFLNKKLKDFYNEYYDFFKDEPGFTEKEFLELVVLRIYVDYKKGYFNNIFRYLFKKIIKKKDLEKKSKFINNFFGSINFYIRLKNYNYLLKKKRKYFFGFFYKSKKRFYSRLFKKFRFFRISKKLYLRLKKKRIAFYIGYPSYLEVNYKIQKLILYKQPYVSSIFFPFGRISLFNFFEYYKTKSYF